MPLTPSRRAATLGLLAAGAALLALIASQRGAPGSLLPHGYCFTWNPTLLWMHVSSDALVGMAYVSIPLTLLHLLKQRTDIPFNWIVWLFALFILSCGATHWIEVWTVWHPDYWLAGSVKVVTAAASVLTAVALIRLVPKLLAVPTVTALTAAKTALETEVAQRRRAESALLEERAQLERRVLDRTQALQLAIAAAEAAHAAAEQANLMKDRFLAKVSHELRTPLQSSLTWAHVLQMPDLDSAGAAKAADRIIRNVRLQARLIDDLLDISRILSGKMSLQPQRVDVMQVVGQAIDVVRSASAARGITVDVDPVRMEQVVWNLVNNAVQASADGGRVDVRASNAPGWLVVAVEDWGRGIDPLDLPHIFEPFRQGQQAANAHRGLGLGLAITRSIVELSGGTLQVHSDGPERGTTVTLRLPLIAADHGLAPARESLADVGVDALRRIAGLRALYVEDDPDIAEGGRLMLESLGLRTALCTTYAQAVERVRAGGFDVLLSDLDLGGGHSALDLLALLRGRPHGEATPALVLSAYGSVDDIRRSLDAGFAGHLVKPIDAAELARALAHLV